MADDNKNVFTDLRDKIYDHTQNIDSQIKEIIPKASPFGFKIKDWFQRNLGGKVSKDIFKYTKGRVPFDKFEKEMLNKAPNVYPSQGRFGFEDIVDFIGDLIEDELEKKSINNVRYQIHTLLNEIKDHFDDVASDNIVIFLQDTYPEKDLGYLHHIKYNWLELFSEEEASLRDQLIGVRTNLQQYNTVLRTVKFGIDNTNDIEKINVEVSLIDGFISKGDSVLTKNATESAIVVEKLKSLLSYTPTNRVRRGEIKQTEHLVSNPLFKHVRNDYLKAQTTSVSRLATSVNGGEEDPRNGLDDVSQATPPDAETTTMDFAEADKIQEEKTVDTLPYKKAVGPLSESDFEKFRQWLGNRESGNNYSAQNRIGFSGRWQWGGPALQDMGYVKPGTSTRDLKKKKNKKVWKGKDGINTTNDFLSNSDVQDRLFVRWTKYNYKRLLNTRSITKESSPAHVAGMLAVCHLLGPGGARAYKNGKNGQDANGTKASDYYNGAAGSIGGPTVTSSSTQAEKYRATVSETTLPDGAKIALPESAAAPLYPYNHTRTFEAGHIEEFDSTPGSERINVKHMSGTGFEFAPDGDAITVVNKDSYKATLGNDFMVVSGDVQIYVEGSCGISANNIAFQARNDLAFKVGGDVTWNVGGSMNESIAGSKQVNVAGDASETVGGYKNTGIDGDLQVVAGSQTYVAEEGNMNIRSRTNVNIDSLKATSIISSEGTSIVSEGNLSITSNGDAQFGAKGDATLYAGAGVTTHGEGSNHMSSPSNSHISSGGTIGLSHPVQMATYADETGVAAVLGATSSPGANSSESDNGGGGNQGDKAKLSDPKTVEKSQDEFEPFDLEKTQANSGGGDGIESSIKDPSSTTA